MTSKRSSFFTTALPPRWQQQWQQLIAPARQQWQALAERERLGLSIAAAVLGLLLVWQIGVASPLRTLREAPPQIDRLDTQLQDMQRLANEARELRAVAPVSSAQAALALQAATEHLGEAAKLTVQGDRATLTLTNASSEQLRSWLGEARSAARARPVQAQLQRGPKGYSGTVVLSLGGLPS
ncbi:type II secretion system protein GspM [Roseateles toxinivorans]|uniref:General secretion pathway protein M n=1 Tax=Roseateles toxinivorans TaxID=270368 RepID=A0A4R6QK15_9BURK|nr:type II secretion system protein GspM [Roseateles toxinivorans]TDP62746.1 general secretion pathway protein M [Roseateles toxinivorans]